MFGEYSHRGNLFFFLKKCILTYFLMFPGFLSKWCCGTLALRILGFWGGGLQWFSSWGGERGRRNQWVCYQVAGVYTFQKCAASRKLGFPSPFIFLRNRRVSHSAAVFRDIWIYNVHVEVSSPLQSVKNSFLVHLFLCSTPSLNIFCKFTLDNPRISVADFSFTIYLACSVTLAETTNLIHDINSKL